MKEYEEIILQIADSGYSGMEAELGAVSETLTRLEDSRTRWQQTAGNGRRRISHRTR